MDRRTFVKGAAWSVPVMAAAVAVPMAAASGQPSEKPCFRFTHTRPHEGTVKGNMYYTLGVLETCGKNLGPVTVSVSALGQTQFHTIDLIPGWREAGPITGYFENVPGKTNIEVIFTATAGTQTITEVKTWRTKKW